MLRALRSRAFSRTLFIILASGLLVRVTLFLFLHGDDAFVMDDDSGGYLMLAENLRTGHGFSLSDSQPFMPDSFRTPGYPVFLLAHRVLTGTYQTALITQSILVVATAWIVANIGFRLGHRRAGLIAAGLFLFAPFSLMVSLRYLTQPLFTFVLTLAVWWWLRFWETGSAKYLRGTAILLPLAAIIRPIAIWLPVPFLAGYALVAWHRREFVLVPFLRAALVVIAVFAIGIAPWCVRNYQRFDSYALSSVKAFQLYFYDLPPVLALVQHSSRADARVFLERDIQTYVTVSNASEFQGFGPADVLTQRSWYYVSRYPIAAAVSRVPLLLSFFTRDGIRYWFEYWQESEVNKYSPVFLSAVILERLLLLALALGFISAIVQSFRRKLPARLEIMAMVIVYFALLSGGVSSAGLRFPVEPLIILLGLIGLNGLYETIRTLVPSFRDRWHG